MKTKHFVYLFLLSISLSAISCRDRIIVIAVPAEPKIEEPLEETSLIVQVTHELSAPGELITEADVDVFIGTHADTSVLISSRSKYPAKTTDHFGEVKFDNLEPGEYFIYGKIQTGNYNHSNYTTDFYTPRELKAGENVQEIVLHRN